MTESSVGNGVRPLASIAGMMTVAGDCESRIFPEGRGRGEEAHCRNTAFVGDGVGDIGRGGAGQKAKRVEGVVSSVQGVVARSTLVGGRTVEVVGWGEA